MSKCINDKNQECIFPDEEKKYYIICTEQYARQGSFLFWKPKGKGYTANIDEAGLFDKARPGGNFVGIEKEVFLNNFKTLTIVEGSILKLKELSKE